MNRIVISILALMLSCTSMLSAQDVKIGYTNVELILVQMPAARAVDKQLRSYEKKLSDQLGIKQQYAQTKYQEYLEKNEEGTLSKEELQEYEKELLKLEKEIREFAQKSDEKLMMKREELLGPVLEDLQDAIDEVAENKGYTYVLNQTTSTGVSTILYGPEENDITLDVMRKLNIPIPEDQQE